jgi:hypothetical protein
MGGVWIDVPVEINDTEADPSKATTFCVAGTSSGPRRHHVRACTSSFADGFHGMKNNNSSSLIANQIALNQRCRIPKIVSTTLPTSRRGRSEMLERLGR